jgi:hypothetical protein
MSSSIKRGFNALVQYTALRMGKFENAGSQREATPTNQTGRWYRLSHLTACAASVSRVRRQLPRLVMLLGILGAGLQAAWAVDGVEYLLGLTCTGVHIGSSPQQVAEMGRRPRMPSHLLAVVIPVPTRSLSIA